MKRIILSEKQSETLAKMLNEDVYTEPSPQSPDMKKANAPFCINPEKVQIVRKFLDKGFKKGSIERVGKNGLPEKVRIVGMLSSNGDVLKNMYDSQLLDLLIDHFQNMFSDHMERGLFLKQVMNDWFNDKISINGLLSKNSLQENVTIEDINKAAEEANLYPTEAQKEAGNYKMGHTSVRGMEISIENPKGSRRYFKNEDGTVGSIVMQNHYGYFRGTSGNGKDGDAVDVFIGPDVDDFEVIYVIDQYIKGEFDESKVMVGFRSKEEAKVAYLKNYNKGWKGLGEITGVSVETFKKWLYRGNKQRKPFSDYVKIKRAKIEESILREESYNEVIKLCKVRTPEDADKVADYLMQHKIDAYVEGNEVIITVERDPIDPSYVEETIAYAKNLAINCVRNIPYVTSIREALDISPKELYKNIKRNTPGKRIDPPAFDGWQPVRKDDKMNLKNEETGEFISDKWYDFVGYIVKGIAIVGDEGRYNLMDENGNLLLKDWHEDVIDTKDGDAYIIIDGRDSFEVTREQILGC